MGLKVKSKPLISSLVFFILISIGLSAQARPLELVTFQYPPYEYEENGEIKGVAVQVVKAVFNRMKQPINITVIPWARALQRIQQGRADAIFTAYRTNARESFADFSNEILMPQTVSLFVRKDTDIEFDGDLAALSDYQFGAVIKVSYGDLFDNAVKDKVISRVQLVGDGKQNLRKLVAGRVDIVVSNTYGARHILQKMDESDAVRELSPVLQNVPSYIAFSKKRELSDVRDRFDKILKSMKDDGSYDEIINAYY